MSSEMSESLAKKYTVNLNNRAVAHNSLSWVFYFECHWTDVKIGAGIHTVLWYV